MTAYVTSAWVETTDIMLHAFGRCVEYSIEKKKKKKTLFPIVEKQ